MIKDRPIHPDFLFLLEFKEKKLIELFKDLREYILDINPGSNELLYHTHALTAVFSISDKLSDAFCMLPIYTNHLNLGFNKGTLIRDPHQLLQGTDYRNKKVKDLIKSAADFAIKDMDKPSKSIGATISKIKRK
jgi:hypothetical protein